MFKISKKTFGIFTEVKLKNLITNESISIIPGFGGVINKLILKKNKLYEIIDGYNTDHGLIKNDWSKSIKLIPFPNRIKDGVYEFDNKTFRLPINFPSQNHAIHGFVYNKLFTILKEEVTKKHAKIKLVYKYNGNNVGYPFKFKVILTYILNKKGFTCNTKIINLDKKDIPIGDGWHPYFKLNKVDDLLLKLPECKKIEVDNRLIPTGEKTEFELFNKLKKINDSKLDTCFQITSNKAITELYDPKTNLKINLWQETGESKYNFLQVFMPPSRKVIALEPMTCNVNAFNNKDNLIILKPNEEFNASYGVYLN